MDILLEKLIEFINDPVLITVIVGFVLTIIILWRIFGKQHEFIKERIELLRQENNDLRIQLKEFKEENGRLRQTTKDMTHILVDLQKQPLLSSETTKSLSLVAEKANYFVGFNREITESIQNASKLLQNGFSSMEKTNLESAHRIQDGIMQIEYVISKKERTNKEISNVLYQLVEFIEENEKSKREQLAQLKENAHQLLKQ